MPRKKKKGISFIDREGKKAEVYVDEQGTKVDTKLEQGITEIILYEPSQKHIKEVINPRVEISNKQRAKERKIEEKMARFQKWLDEKFG